MRFQAAITFHLETQSLNLEPLFVELTISTPTLLFPASSLLFLAYTNRFLHLSALIRTLHLDFRSSHSPVVEGQLKNLRWRLSLIRGMQAFGVVSLIFCLASMTGFYFESEASAKLLFGLALGLMGVSLLMALAEILLSGGALAIFLKDMGDESGRSSHSGKDDA